MSISHTSNIPLHPAHHRNALAIGRQFSTAEPVLIGPPYGALRDAFAIDPGELTPFSHASPMREHAGRRHRKRAPERRFVQSDRLCHGDRLATDDRARGSKGCATSTSLLAPTAARRAAHTWLPILLRVRALARRRRASPRYMP